MFVDWYLPGYRAGGPIRSVANMVRELGEEFDFRIVTSDTDFGASAPYQDIQPNTWTTGPNGEQVWYFSGDQLNRAAINQLIDATPHQLVYLNSFFSLPFSLWPLWHLRKQQHKVLLAPRGMLGAGALQLKATKKKLFLLASKATGLHSNIGWHASTEQEGAEIKAVFGNKARVFTALNIAARNNYDNLPPRTKQPGTLRLFFLSRISPKKNLLEAIQMLGTVEIQQGQRIVYDVYGPVDDAAYWEQCQQAIAQLPQGVEVKHHGAIANDDLAEHLAEAHCLLLPTRHENYGHAILEAFALGCPVIVSDQTPWRDLQAKGIGWDLPLSSEATFAATVRLCLEMPQQEFDRMSGKARTFAREFTSNQDVLEQNRSMFRSLIQST